MLHGRYKEYISPEGITQEEFDNVQDLCSIYVLCKNLSQHKIDGKPLVFYLLQNSHDVLNNQTLLKLSNIQLRTLDNQGRSLLHIIMILPIKELHYLIKFYNVVILIKKIITIKALYILPVNLLHKTIVKIKNNIMA